MNSVLVKKIGTCVEAYDREDGSTILLCLNEAIDHRVQEDTMLPLTQLRHHGVDVCDIHPKFKRDGKPGLFRIKAGDHEIPFRMEID